MDTKRLSRVGLLFLLTLPPTVVIACSDDGVAVDDVPDAAVTASVDGATDATGRAPEDDAPSDSAPAETDSGDVTDAGAPDADAADADAGVPSSCSSTPCVIDVGAGSGHVCALLSSGAVSCWGQNFYGQGGGTDASAQSTPVPVGGLGVVKQLAVGWYHNCALLSDDTVWCWGNNRFGQLARPTDGGDYGTSTPMQVTGFTEKVLELAAGGYHTCARLQNGQVACWGQNNAGQIGVGDPAALNSSSYVATPTVVPNITAVVALGTTNRVSCVKQQNSGVSCWGSNAQGQLGDDGNGVFVPHPAPVAVVGLAGPVVELGKGHGYHQLVRTANGAVQMWGDNAAHVAGYPDAGAFVPKATTIPSLTADQVSASGFNSCVLRSTGDVWCWGRNTRGANGVPPSAGTYQDTPTLVTGTSNAVRVSVGWEQFACALIDGGAVRCWGDNVYGELGRGADAGAFDPTPQPVTF